MRPVIPDVTQAINLHIILGLTNFFKICFEVQLTAVTYKTVLYYSNILRLKYERSKIRVSITHLLKILFCF